MKVTLLIFLISVACAYGTSNEKLDYMDKTLYVEAFQSKCIRNGQSNDYFKRTYNATYDCISKAILSKPPDPIEKHEEFCKYLKERQFYECIKNFTTDLLPCLNETEIYIQDFVLNAMKSGYNDICGPAGLSNLKYLEDKFNRTGECIAYGGLFYIGSGKCLSDLTFFKNLEEGIINLNKKSVCFDFYSLRNCTTPLTEKRCDGKNGTEDVSRLNDLAFSPFLDQCKDFNEINSV